METTERRPYKKHPLRDKFTYLIVGTAVILSVLAVAISYQLYIDKMDTHTVTICNGALNLVEMGITGDEVSAFLKEDVESPAYREKETQLKHVLDGFDEITYLYVYQITEDYCKVVFDIDTEDLPGEMLGTTIPLDDSFRPYLADLLAGREIEPVISDDQYGWLVSVYRPMFDSSGKCVAYAAVDVSMDSVRSDRYIFIIRVISLLTGATILIAAFAVWYAQTKLANPINRLASFARNFAYDSTDDKSLSIEQLEELQVHTGDEVENLSDSITKMVSDTVQYVGVIKEKSRELSDKANLILRMQNNIIISFANMIENRDACTGSHVRHTAAYVGAISRALAALHIDGDELTEEEQNTYQKCAPLHDIGKIRISDMLLNKPGRLTPEEFDEMKTHTTAGGEILRETLAGIEDQTYLAQAIEMASCHHERWDGKGYPKGIAGKDIPLCARIMAVADVFDALISRRSYKEPMSFDDAVETIRSESGTHFDPDVVKAFLSALDDIRRIANDEAEETLHVSADAIKKTIQSKQQET